MIPYTIAQLADALEAEFGIGRDEAVAAAWRIAETMKAGGVELTDTDQ